MLFVVKSVVLRSSCRLLPRSSLLSCRQMSSGAEKPNPFLQYLRSLKWAPIPMSVGFAYICYQQYGHVIEREHRQMKLPGEVSRASGVAPNWQVIIYRALPLNFISRLWGKLNSIELAVPLRAPLYKLYISLFGCNLDEAAIQDLEYYRNLGEFFRRRLRPGCRPVDKKALLTSPSDGKILHCGRIRNGQVEQVKGVTYPLEGFLGPADNTQGVKHNPQNELYHCVVYLAPGDYHGFHSPSEWTVSTRRHFPGDLLSVSEIIARRVQGLFNYNERAVYCGTWQHGFFAMAAVGATNVGSIKVYHDKTLVTNSSEVEPNASHRDQLFRNEIHNGVPMRKGDPFGEFNLGSTIVLIFEAPPGLKFHVPEGRKVKFGQRLASLR